MLAAEPAAFLFLQAVMNFIWRAECSCKCSKSLCLLFDYFDNILPSYVMTEHLKHQTQNKHQRTVLDAGRKKCLLLSNEILKEGKEKKKRRKTKKRKKKRKRKREGGSERGRKREKREKGKEQRKKKEKEKKERKGKRKRERGTQRERERKEKEKEKKKDEPDFFLTTLTDFLMAFFDLKVCASG